MSQINTPEELFIELNKLTRDNSVKQFIVPRKGKFTLVYLEEAKTIGEEMEVDKELKEMIHESRKDYKEGRYKTTNEFIDSINEEVFFK